MSMTPYLPQLFQPGRIGRMATRNRIVMPPMGTNMAGPDGSANEAIRRYYEARARGGAGLIIVETCCVDAPTGKTTAGQMAIDHDKLIPRLAQLASTIQAHDCRAVLQLQHGGRGTKSSITGVQPVAPSSVAMPYGTLVGYEGEMPRELAREEIKGLVQKFAQAAARAKAAGFDGVEVHATGYYLVAQFLSSTANQRRDEYGGNLDNRARFLMEIVKAIKQQVGEDFPVLCKISALEIGPGSGLTPEEACRIAEFAEEAGADALELAGMLWGAVTYLPPPTAEPAGGLISFAEKMKQAVKLPIIVAGRMSPELGESAIGEGRADFIAIGKGLIADPELPNKAAAGRIDDIRPCIGCIRCIDNQTVRGLSLMCSVNPAAAREVNSDIVAASQSRNVAVVGGGPAGMEAARVAALRGHNVTLYDRRNELGGQLLEAVIPPHKDHMRPFLEYLRRQMAQLGIDIRCGVELSLQKLMETGAETAVLATGVAPVVPAIPGLENANAAMARDVLHGAETGQSVLVIGGGLVGCETAEYLAKQGKKVTVAEMLDEVAGVMPLALRLLLLARLEEMGVKILTGMQCREWTENGMRMRDQTGQEVTISAESVVLAAGGKPDQSFPTALTGNDLQVHRAGDCVQPRGIAEAVAEGFQAGLAL